MFECHIITVPDWLCVTHSDIVTVLIGDIILSAFEKILVLFSGHRKSETLHFYKCTNFCLQLHNLNTTAH